MVLLSLLAITVSPAIPLACTSILSPAPRFRIGVVTIPMFRSDKVFAPLPKPTEEAPPSRRNRNALFSRVKDWPLLISERGVAAVPRRPPSTTIAPVPVTAPPGRLTVPVTIVVPAL